VLDGLEVLDVGLLDDLCANAFGERDGAASEGAALIAEGKLGALAVQYPRDAQAIERSLATPITKPLFPAINGAGSAISLVVAMFVTLVVG